MQKKSQTYLIVTGTLFILFVVFTVMVKTIDVKPIGPLGSSVGFATINQFVFELTGVNLLWYDITGWLGYGAIAIAIGFGIFGLYQLMREKSIRKVDSRILLLGGFYFIVVVFYIIFEFVIVNYRPVVFSQGLEASYPSSHTMAIICIMGTAMLQFHHYLKDKKKWVLTTEILSILIIAVTVIGRMVSGVHWFTDIVAGMILAAALVVLYCFAIEYLEEKSNQLITVED